MLIFPLQYCFLGNSQGRNCDQFSQHSRGSASRSAKFYGAGGGVSQAGLSVVLHQEYLRPVLVPKMCLVNMPRDLPTAGWKADHFAPHCGPALEEADGSDQPSPIGKDLPKTSRDAVAAQKSNMNHCFPELKSHREKDVHLANHPQGGRKHSQV